MSSLYFATVRLVEGAMTHFLLVLDEDTADFIGGGENIRSKDYMALHHSAEVFVRSPAKFSLAI